MFNDAEGEHTVVCSKVEPFLKELREVTGNSKMLTNLEMLLMRQPNVQEMLAGRREMTKRMIEASQSIAKNG